MTIIQKTATMLLAGALALPALAAGPMAKAEIPFPFEAKGRTFAAGKYTVEANTQNGVITLRGEKGESAMLPTIPAGNPNVAKPAQLVFLKQGGSYTLAGGRIVTVGSGFEITRAKRVSGEKINVNLSR